MGCGSSSGSNRRVESQPPHLQIDNADIFIYKAPNSIQLAFGFILNECSIFGTGTVLVPSVCVESNAFPVIVAKMVIDDDNTTKELPILTAAFYDQGRIMLFPHIDIITDISHIESRQESKILQNAFNWLSRANSTMTPILLLSFPQLSLQDTYDSLHNCGYFVEVSNKFNNLKQYKIVFIPSDYEASDDAIEAITKYISDGGSLAVFYSPSVSKSQLIFPTNNITLQFGLGYTLCSFREQSEPIPISTDFQQVQKFHFNYLYNKVITYISDPKKVETSVLDEIVTTIQLHTMLCTDVQADRLLKLTEACWNYLMATDAVQSDTFCPEVNQRVVLMLLQDNMNKLPPQNIKAIDGYERFPGKCGDVVFGDFERVLEVVGETWVSTGLYLPAGVIATVEAEADPEGLQVQIGAHHESLLLKDSPWKRWPSVVNAFELNPGKTEIISPFGGPLYIVADENFEKEMEIKITFHNTTQYPRYVINQPEIWESTKDIQTPFGELETEFVILTMPSNILRELDLGAICEKLDQLTEVIIDYMAYDMFHKFRVVFDIELFDTSQPACGYPIIFLIDNLKPMFDDVSRPNSHLFTLITLFAILTLKEDCFDDVVETSLVMLAASVSFTKIYTDFDPFSSEYQVTPLFNGLWQIQLKYPNVITETLQIFQHKVYDANAVPDDTWIDFVQNMCKIGKVDFTTILEKSRPIPLNVTMSCHAFSSFDELFPTKMVNSSILDESDSTIPTTE